MAAKTTRLQLPLTNYIGARGVGTITAIGPGDFQTVEDRFVPAISEMLVSVDNNIVLLDNEIVTL